MNKNDIRVHGLVIVVDSVPVDPVKVHMREGEPVQPVTHVPEAKAK